MSVRILVTATTALFLAATAQAATVYDESVNGDAGPTGAQGPASGIPTAGAASLGLLAPESDNQIVGSVTGGSIDNVDIYSFLATADFTIDVEGFTPGDFNESSSFRLTRGGSPTLFEAGTTLSRSVSGPVSDLFGVISAGSYFFSVMETNSASPAEYTATVKLGGLPGPIPSVPIPATMALLAGALAVLGKVSLRKR